MVIDAIQAGNLGKTTTRLASTGIVPATHEVSSHIRELLIPQHVRPLTTVIDGDLRGVPVVSTRDIASMLRQVPKRAAMDAYGWTYEHLQLLLGHNRGWSPSPPSSTTLTKEARRKGCSET